MAILTGSIIVAGRMGDLNKLVYVKGVYTLAAAFITTNTHEFDFFGATELNGYDYIPVGFNYFGVNADTNATPTGLITIGDSADPDGLLKSKAMSVALQNSLANQVRYFGDGDLIKNGTKLTGSKVIITTTANPATGATNGDIFVEGWFKAVAKNA